MVKIDVKIKCDKHLEIEKVVVDHIVVDHQVGEAQPDTP
jgi:hypothetical protein